MPDKLTDNLLQWAQSIQDIAASELPQFAHEIIAYKIWEASIWFYGFFVLTVIVGVFFILVMLGYILDKDKHKESDPCWVIGFMLVISMMFTLTQYSYVKKCEVAPRLVLLETIKR